MAGIILVALGVFVLIVNVIRTSAVSAPAASRTNSASSQGYKDLEIAKGAPASSVTKAYEGFTVCFNPENKTPDWVGWELLGSEVANDVSRSDNFWQDYDLNGCPSPTDYKRSGFDKGHLCPAADQKYSAAAMSDCFVMSNMAPQTHALNAGAWLTLEEKERRWAQRDSALVIVAGPLYNESDNQRIGEAGVRVPSAFYKVFLSPYLDDPQAIGFIFPNMKCPGNMMDYAMSIDDVEKVTGLDFFSALPDELENKVEQSFSSKFWLSK